MGADELLADDGRADGFTDAGRVALERDRVARGVLPVGAPEDRSWGVRGLSGALERAEERRRFAELLPGTVIVHRPSGAHHVLDRRKDGPDEGWWLRDGGGLSDHAWAVGDWAVVPDPPLEPAEDRPPARLFVRFETVSGPVWVDPDRVFAVKSLAGGNRSFIFVGTGQSFDVDHEPAAVLEALRG